jgi:hypothetical protein
MTLPMLADFALRLAGGMAALLLVAPWRVVPPSFYRTHCLVILGLLVLGALATSREQALPSWWTAAAVGASALAFLASAGWGMGADRLGRPLTWGVVAAVVAVLVGASRGGGPALWSLNASGRLASAAALGSTLSAMLLGHHYLTAPAMSIEPLKRYVRWMGGTLAVRAAFAAAGLALFWWGGAGTSTTASETSPLFLAVRWGMGLAGPALATYLAWRTVRIRSTQSATGILYIATTLVLFGELSAMVLARQSGHVF